MNFRERIEQAQERRNSPLAANNNDLNESGFDAEFFGIDNIKSFPACLDLRFADGTRKALPYSFITELDFNPSNGINIMTPSRIISITGRKLERLFDYLAAYRVRYIQANIGADLNENCLFVKEILTEEI